MSAGGRREVAFRVFAAEYDDADMEHRESDEERAPNYVVTPTGARANRLFAAGVLTAVERVNEDMLRGRVSDPTGAFVLYAGQYQPDAEAFLERTDPPAYVAVTGKTRTFRPEDGDRVFTSLRPESITAVDSETRDRWTVAAAEQTLRRVATMAVAAQRPERGTDLREWLGARGVQEGVAAGVALALDHYGTTPAYLAAVRERALQAAEVVAGDREQVDPLDVAPDETGDADLDALADPELAGIDAGPAADEGQTTGGAAPTAGGAAATGDDATATDEGPADAAASETPTDADESTDAGEAAAETAAAGQPADESPSGADADEPAAPAADPGDERYELDDEERERIEAEHGTDFSTAAEVDEPGSADIDVPESDSGTAADATDADGEEGDEDDEEGDEDDELEDAAVDAMRTLDDGDGAAREAVVERVREETGAGADAVEDAIQDALMDGRCYEPDDATLKPI